MVIDEISSCCSSSSSLSSSSSVSMKHQEGCSEEGQENGGDPKEEEEEEEEEEKKNTVDKEPFYTEDIVEGFSFLSFDSFEDLEKVAKWSELHSGKLPDPFSPIQFEKEEKKPRKKKKKRDPTANKECESLVEINGDKGSTGSNSEKGYICDSDSDEERGSDNGVEDLFNSRKSSSGSSTPCQANGVTSTATSSCTTVSGSSGNSSSIAALSTSSSSTTTSSSPPTAIVTPSVIVTTVPSSSNTVVTPSTSTVTSKSFFRPYSISPPPPRRSSSAKCKQEEVEDSPLVAHHHQQQQHQHHPAYRPSFGSSVPPPGGGYHHHHHPPYHPPAPPQLNNSTNNNNNSSSNKRPYDYSQFIPPHSYYPPSHIPHPHHHHNHPHYSSPHYNLPGKEEYGPDAKRVAYSVGVASNFGPHGYPSKGGGSPSPIHYPPNYPKHHPFSSGHKGPVPSSVPSSTSISIHSASSHRENSSSSSSWNSSRSAVRSGSSGSTSMAPSSAITPGVITPGLPPASSSSMSSRIRQELDSRYYPGSSPYLMHPRSDILLGGPPSRPMGPSYLSNSMLKDVPKVGEDPFRYQRPASTISGGVVGKSPSPYNAPMRPTLSSTTAPTTTSFTAPSLQGSSAPKKSGKWNAMHVRIAWEIYNHQQKHKPDIKNSQSGGSTPTSVAGSNPPSLSSSKVEALKPKAPPPMQHYLPPSSNESSNRPDLLHHSKASYSAEAPRVPNPSAHHLLNPFNLRPPLGVPPSLFAASSPLDVLNPYARFGGPAGASPAAAASSTSPNPFGGLGSVRSDPFGLRPGGGMWPLKSESSLLSAHERKRREDQVRREKNYVRDRERNGGSSARESSRSPIRSSSLSGSPSGRSNASPLVPTKKEERPSSVLDMSRPGSSSSVKQMQDDVILVVPPPLASNEGRHAASTPNGRSSVNSNNSRTTPNHNMSSSSNNSTNNNRPPSAATRSPQVRPSHSSRGASSAAPSSSNPFGMFSPPSNPSINPIGFYGLPPFGLDPFRDPYKSLMGGPPGGSGAAASYHPPSAKDHHLREARERDLLRSNPLGSMIVSEQDRARMAALSSGAGYHPVPGGHYLGAGGHHPPPPPSSSMLNQSYGGAPLKTAPPPPSSHHHHHLGMYPGYHHPSINGAPGSSAPYK